MDSNQISQPQEQISNIRPVPSLPEYPKKNRPLFIGIVILAFTVLATISLLAYQNWLLNQRLTALLTTPTSSLTPTPTVKPVANTSVYKNTQFGYSFEFPQGWKILGLSPGEGINVVSSDSRGVMLVPSDTDNSQKPAAFIQIEVEPPENISRGSFQEWINNNLKAINLKIDKETDTVIDGQSAIVIESKYSENSVDYTEKNLYFQDKNGENYYYIGTTDDSKKSHRQLFDQILNSFRFIDDYATIKTNG